jgi:predicted Zn finger-like uncharacterized protein
MQTKCPQCKSVFPINLNQLRSARGTVQCGECLLKFNALSALHEASELDNGSPQNTISTSSIPLLQQEQEESSVDTEEVQPSSDEASDLIAPWETDKPTTSWGTQLFWFLASVASLFLLAGQFYLNEVSHNFQNQRARAFFELGCEQLGCELPAVKNSARIDVVDRSIETRDDALFLKITLANHASHSQPFPNLKLTLSDFKSRPVAQRVFTSTEYLPKNRPNKLMATDEPVELQLAIVPLKETISTFSFELL